MPTKTVKKAPRIAKPLPPADRHFNALSDAEKEAVFESFDRPTPRSQTRPLTAAERKRWDATQAALKAKRPGPGRPRVGKGTRSVLVSIERQLLAEADRYAKAHQMKRTELVAVGLRLAMRAGATGESVSA
jgi:hypothetical protein